jgi:hypothetical protein
MRRQRQLQQDGADKPFFVILFTDERTGFAIGAYGVCKREPVLVTGLLAHPSLRELIYRHTVYRFS